MVNNVTKGMLKNWDGMKGGSKEVLYDQNRSHNAGL